MMAPIMAYGVIGPVFGGQSHGANQITRIAVDMVLGGIAAQYVVGNDCIMF